MTNYRVTYNDKPLGFRLAHAESHRQDMRAKYLKVYGWENGSTKANYWDMWHHTYQVVCEPFLSDVAKHLGQEPTIWTNKTHYDSPLAYDVHNFLHLFCRLILKGNPLKIHTFLSEQFSGDLIDRTYIRGLIAQMKIMKLFTNGAAVIFDGTGTYRQLEDTKGPRILADEAYSWHYKMMRPLVSHSRLRLLASEKWYPLRARRGDLKYREDIRIRYTVHAGFSWQQEELFNGSATNIARLELVEDWLKLREQEEHNGTLQYIPYPPTSDFEGEQFSDEILPIKSEEQAQDNQSGNLISHKQLALLIYFQGGRITDNNAAAIVAQYGKDKNPGSAKKLKGYWDQFCNEKIWDGGHEKRTANWLKKDIEAIIPMLQKDVDKDKAWKLIKTIENKTL